jgi:MFS family permease
MMLQASPARDETSPRYHGWRVVAVCFLLALFCWGFGFYGHAVYLAELQRLHGWPAGLISGATTAFYLLSAVMAAFVSDGLARFGPKRFVLGGIGCMTVAALLLPQVRAPWQLYAVYLLMACGWAAMGLACITSLLGLWFRERRGMAISLALNGASCGGVVFAPLLVLLIDRVGFAPAMWMATAAMLLVLLPLVLAWVDRPPRDPGAAAAWSAGAQSVAARWTKARALRSPHFWSVAGPFALALAAQVGFIVHQIAFLEPLLGRAGAGAAVAVTTTMAVVGRVGLGAVIDRLDQRITSALSFASQAAALLVMTQSESVPVLLAACAVFGFSVGNLITFPSLIIQREFDPAAFGLLAGLAVAVCQFAFAAGPGALGVLRDATGSYTVPLLVCVGLDLVATIIVLIRPKAATA